MLSGELDMWAGLAAGVGGRDGAFRDEGVKGWVQGECRWGGVQVRNCASAIWTLDLGSEPARG